MAKALGVDFSDVMARRTKEQLLSVLREAHDYVPEALQAANAELERRGVNRFDIAAAEDMAEDNVHRTKLLASESMRWPEALLWLLLPVLSMTPWGTARFRKYANAGYRRKSLQLLELSFIGFSLYSLAFLIVVKLFRSL
ncbi:MAG TPA: hypothetical protein VHS96_11175 [Bacteroidia bacterium]|nr:hypothetical protein [Bacteroidia bacterium]